MAAGEQHREIVATDPCQQVPVAKLALPRRCEELEERISCQVPEAIARTSWKSRWEPMPRAPAREMRMSAWTGSGRDGAEPIGVTMAMATATTPAANSKPLA